ncbi:hypothetical protein [Neisseria elongata]|uniref:Uncharacterized protein n=1 Tax=Neisseria elongata subsp. nitroreducens TaxID=90367 RepID=A0A9X1CYL6_NEIEL|nr:hypothetical protein [Neisseria elongata]MBS9340084.1 hypothetical protein [Neisseria elongata subsp. nitroreducens]
MNRTETALSLAALRRAQYRLEAVADLLANQNRESVEAEPLYWLLQEINDAMAAELDRLCAV